MGRKSKRRRDPRQTLTPAASIRFAIKDCPAEIWGRIFSLACVDDGFTGRSLSRVSRYIMEASKPYKYQCLAVKDHQLRLLALILRKLPADLRRVRCLFITQACLEKNRWGARSEFFLTDKNRILKMVAPTLEKLEIGCFYYRFPLPFQLPVLVDLTLHGQHDGMKPLTKVLVCYPALRRLQLEWFPSSNYDVYFVPLLNVTAPSISIIRLSTSFSSETTAAFSALKTKLQIQKILFQPHASWEYNMVYQAWRAGYLRNLRTNTQKDDGLVLLKVRTAQTPHHRASAAKARWLEACAGRTDYWEPTEEELDSEVLAASSAA